MTEAAEAFVWYELMTSDTAAAAEFYSKVVGWRIEDSGMEGFDYSMMWVGEAVVGGLMELPAEAKASGAVPAWVGYVGVADADAMVEKVKAAGGTIYSAPQDIPGIGRFAVCADPHGAVFNLFEPGDDSGPPSPAPGTLGTISWHELYAGDGDAAFAFYAGLFGWTKGQAVPMGPMGTYQLFGYGPGDATGREIGGMMTRPEQIPVPFWNYYFLVDGIDAAAERVRAAGGQVVNGPMPVPDGSWIIQGMDPQGVFFSLNSKTR